MHYEYSHVVVLGLSKSKDLQSKDASNSSRIESKLASQPERWFSIQFRLFELIILIQPHPFDYRLFELAIRITGLSS